MRRSAYITIFIKGGGFSIIHSKMGNKTSIHSKWMSILCCRNLYIHALWEYFLQWDNTCSTHIKDLINVTGPGFTGLVRDLTGQFVALRTVHVEILLWRIIRMTLFSGRFIVWYKFSNSIVDKYDQKPYARVLTGQFVARYTKLTRKVFLLKIWRWLCTL